jgi:hypothetical protein
MHELAGIWICQTYQRRELKIMVTEKVLQIMYLSLHASVEENACKFYFDWPA